MQKCTEVSPFCEFQTAYFGLVWFGLVLLFLDVIVCVLFIVKRVSISLEKLPSPSSLSPFQLKHGDMPQKRGLGW